MAYYLYKKIRDRRTDSTTNTLFDNFEEKPTPTVLANSGEPITEVREGPCLVSHEITAGKESKDVGLVEHEDSNARKVELRAMRLYRWRLIVGLFFPSVVQALSHTMIAAALPWIGSDFNELGQLHWIISAFNLTSAVFIPAFGQFADIFGRYWTMQASGLIMILGSALCAGTPVTNFSMLLAGRGIQGIASAGILIMTKIILADKVSLKDNAKNNTVFTLVIGIGYGVGPVIGGYLTEVSWRWCFIIDIPLAAFGLVLMHFVARPVLLGPQYLPAKPKPEQSSSSATFLQRISTIDIGGQLMFLFGMGLVVLALTWAGSYYPWSDVSVVAPLTIGVASLVVFLVWEFLLLPGKALATKFPHQQAMIPLKLVWTRNASVLVYVNFITGQAMYAVFYFVELYFTLVKQLDSGDAGVNLLFYVPGLGVGTYAAMFLCNVWPCKTWHPLSIGTSMEAIGITVLAVSLKWGQLPTIYGMLVLTGVGTGLRYMPGTLHGVGYYRQDIASIVSLMSLSMTSGSTLASTIMLNIFNNKLSNAGIDLTHGVSSASSFAAIHQMAKDQQVYLRDHAKNGIVVAFFGISSFMWLGVIVVAFLGNVDIKKHPKEPDTCEDGGTEAGNLTKGSYIGSVLRHRKRPEGEQV